MKIRRFAFLFVLVAVFVGCGGGEEPAPPTAAPPANPAPPKPPPKEQVKEPEPEPPKKEEEKLTPYLNLTLDEPIESKKCVATLGAGVLQVLNYDVGKAEKYPAIFLWSKTGIENFKGLEGNTVDAQLFVQKSAESKPLHASQGATVKLKITKVRDSFIAGEVSEGKLFDIDSGRNIDVQCEFVAEFQPPAAPAE